uniref:G-patch domain-containing protein n=1 Tax=Chenopodium quinoa TaxID=63459 RepID=A0A803N2H8_CHEQI
MLIMLKNLNDFYYCQMVTMRYNILGHMEQHGFDIDTYKLINHWPRVNPCAETSERRSFTEIYDPLSVVYRLLNRQGLIRTKGYVCAIPPPEVNMERYCSYCSQFGHTTDSCYDLRCSIQDLIDHEGVIKPLPRRPGASLIGVDLHKYCHYHQLHGHDTDGCHALRLRIKHPTSLMTFDPLSEEMGRMTVNEPLSPAPQSGRSPGDKELFWIGGDEFVMTTDGEHTAATKVASIQSITPLGPLTKGPQLMMKMGYVPGQGLGRNNEGRRDPIPIVDKKNRHGLGYDPSHDFHIHKRSSLTLNGQFILQNDTEPYHEFPDPWYDFASQKISLDWKSSSLRLETRMW